MIDYAALIAAGLIVMAALTAAAVLSRALDGRRRRARRDDPLGIARAIGMLDSNTRRLQAERRSGGAR